MGWMGQDSPGGVLHLKSRYAYGAKTDAGRNGIHKQAEHQCQESCGCQQPGRGLAPQKSREDVTRSVVQTTEARQQGEGHRW